MRNQGLGSWTERRLRMSPQRDALWFEGVTVSHAELAHDVRRVADSLSGLGVARGDRVAWISVNHPSGLETLYACGQLGAVWVPVNARFTAAEAQYVIEHSGAKAVVYGHEHAALAEELRILLPGVESWIGVELDGSNGPSDTHDYGKLVQCASPDYRDEPVTLDDACLIMYTSGTTGRPKGAVLTHGNMTWACLNQILSYDFAQNERTLALGPLFHIGGLNGTVNPTLLRGGCVVMVRAFDSTEALNLIEQQRVTSFFAVPTMLDSLSAQEGFRACDLTSLRTICAAGAPLPMSTLRTWTERGITVQQAYGMTESAPAGTVLDAGDAIANIGSAGQPQFFTDVKVVRPDGSTAAPGEVGEVVLSGPNIMAGYWNDPERTAEVLVDGWYHSGDAGEFDDRGFLYIRDRYKDMIISGGENVYPAEVESAIREHPDVLEAAVIGVTDPKWGEVGVAFVVSSATSPDPEQLRHDLRSSLAGYKIPKVVRFVESLPKTATGKIRKPDLRNAYER